LIRVDGFAVHTAPGGFSEWQRRGQDHRDHRAHRRPARAREEVPERRQVALAQRIKLELHARQQLTAQDVGAQAAIGLVRNARLLGSGVHADVGSGKIHPIHHIRLAFCQRMAGFQQSFRPFGFPAAQYHCMDVMQ